MAPVPAYLRDVLLLTQTAALNLFSLAAVSSCFSFFLFFSSHLQQIHVPTHEDVHARLYVHTHTLVRALSEPPSSWPLVLGVAYGSCTQLINRECHSAEIERKLALNRQRDQSDYWFLCSFRPTPHKQVTLINQVPGKCRSVKVFQLIHESNLKTLTAGAQWRAIERASERTSTCPGLRV